MVLKGKVVTALYPRDAPILTFPLTGKGFTIARGRAKLI